MALTPTPKPTKPARRRSVIRRSRPEDIIAIRRWLDEEKAQGVHGNFLCNWSIILRAHRDGELLVYIDGHSSLPIAFQLGRLLDPGILQVKKQYRGRGIGSKMVEHCVKLALKQDQCLLYIQCKPSSSIPFWQRMGFTLISDASGSDYAYRILEKRFPLPEEGVPTKVTVRFYPVEKKWNDTTPPCLEHSPVAKALEDGTVKLSERVFFHEYANSNIRDVVVEIEIDGKRRYLDKAKYPEAQRLGISRCMNGWYIDQVQPTQLP